jgi:GxxExxY protein
MEVPQIRDAERCTIMTLKELQNLVVASALEVHKNMGLGFEEEAYSKALAVEFDLRGIPHESQREVTLDYKGSVAGTYTLQFVVDNRIVVVVKADTEIEEMDEAKVRTYLKVSKLPLGIILDFGRSDLEIQSVHRK